MAKIESLLQDEPFSTSISDDAYAFVRDDQGRLVTEVWKPRHISAFLSRADAYREIAEDAVVEDKPAPASTFDPATANRAALIDFLGEREATFHVTMKTEALRDIASALVARTTVAAPDVAAAALSLPA